MAKKKRKQFNMPFIHKVACAFPKHYYDQEVIIEKLKEYWGKKYFNPARIEAFHRNVMVGGRHLALEIDEYENLTGFAQKNDAWIRVGSEIAYDAVTTVLESAGVHARDVQYLVSNTVTGISVPTLDAKLMNRIPFSRHTKRLPIFGLGCLAGVAGINRVAEYLRANPGDAAIFFSVELCSLTVQFEDVTIPNIVSTGLFGDGGASVLMVGDAHPLAETSPLEWLDSHSAFFPNSERVMGWDMVDSGFKIVLGKTVSDYSSKHIPEELQHFLNKKDLTRQSIRFFVAHPGGPKVLRSMEKGLGLNGQDLKYSWDSLRKHGNLSSVSVLFVLNQTLETLPPKGALGLMLALGPAFCAEMALVQSNV